MPLQLALGLFDPTDDQPPRLLKKRYDDTPAMRAYLRDVIELFNDDAADDPEITDVLAIFIVSDSPQNQCTKSESL